MPVFSAGANAALRMPKLHTANKHSGKTPEERQCDSPDGCVYSGGAGGAASPAAWNGERPTVV